MIGTTSSGISYQLKDIYFISGAAGILLHRNGKFTMGKSFVLNCPSLFDLKKNIYLWLLLLGLFPLRVPKWFRLFTRATNRTNNLSIILWKQFKKSDDNFIANKENDKIVTILYRVSIKMLSFKFAWNG